MAESIDRIDGLKILNRVELNQIAVACENHEEEDWKIRTLVKVLNERHGVFVHSARWKGRTVLRWSVISMDTGRQQIDALAAAISSSWRAIDADCRN